MVLVCMKVSIKTTDKVVKRIRTRPDGSKYDGIWKNGKLWNGTIYLKNETILLKYEDGLTVKKSKKLLSSS
jgi:hypothetical protein